MPDRNGYNESIMPTTEGVCFCCGRGGETARHEIYFGSSRKVSKEQGFWVYICPACHQHSSGSVHSNSGRGKDKFLKQACQQIYEKTHTREEFMRLIGRSYL